MRFVDLFAGLGGFHLALRRLGHECVFASELDPGLATLYKKNFGIEPSGDIRNVELRHPLTRYSLCRLPMSALFQGWRTAGLKCPQWGDLIDYVVRILQHHKPRYFIIENVPNSFATTKA